MKSYEQRYKAALEWMQGLYSGLHGATKEDAEHYFPELKENKSERIRKGLIKTISSLLDNTILYHTDITKEEALAWLENQKVTGEEIIFRPIVGTDIRIAAKQALEKIDIGKKVVLAFNGAYILVNGKTVGEIDSEYDAWLEKQGEQKFSNIPSRETILAVWELGNDWKDLTKGVCSTEHGSQLKYIQNHWQESSYYDNIMEGGGRK